MNESRPNIEIIAPSIEEAVEKGLLGLGVSKDDVDIEVIDEGSRGLFGLGSRQARVKITVKSNLGDQSSTRSISPTETKPSVETTTETFEKEPTPSRTSENDYVLGIAQAVVIELLEKMRVHAKVTAIYGEAEDARNRIPIRVNIQGDDLSYLIGRQAETLNALQYISSLIISKEIGRTIPLVVDVEGYRTRRENQLRQLARRMAEQAVKTGRRQILEPMPANERRIIHVELKDHPEVVTESIDEEPHRKITIVPK